MKRKERMMNNELEKAMAMVKSAEQDGMPAWATAKAQIATAYAMIAIVRRIDAMTVEWDEGVSGLRVDTGLEG